MPELDLQADPREIITRMWPEHAKHLSPAGNTMGGGKIDPDEGVVCNCGQVLGFPTVQDEADYVMAEPEQPDTSGAQTGEPDDDPDGTEAMHEAQQLIQDVADGRRVERVREGQEGIDSVDVDHRRSHDTSGEYHEGEHGPEPDWTPQLTGREHAADPDGDMPEGWQDAAAAGWAENPIGQAYAMGHAAGERAAEHRGEEATADEAGWNDLVSDEAQADEAQAGWSDLKAELHGVPTGQLGEARSAWEAQAGPPYAVGDKVTVAGIEFTKHSENPFPQHGEAQGVWAAEHDLDGAAPQPGETGPDYSLGVPGLSVPGETPNGRPKGVMPWRDQGVVPAEDPIAARVVVIDPTQPYGPRDVEQQLLDIAGRIERGVHYQRYWEECEFAAEAVYTDKSARARWDNRGSGAKDIRDAAVQMACKEEWQELLLCRAMVRAVKETMHNLRSLQSGYQSVARSVNESTRNPAGSYGRA